MQIILVKLIFLICIGYSCSELRITNVSLQLDTKNYTLTTNRTTKISNISLPLNRSTQNVTLNINQLTQNTPINLKNQNVTVPINQPAIQNVTLSLNEPVKNLTSSVDQPIKDESIYYVNSRIVHKLDLKEIYPQLSANKEFEVHLSKIKTSKNFESKFNFVFENSKIYFLTSIQNPSILKLNIYLNSHLQTGINEDLKKFSKIFEIKEHEQKRIHTFKMEFFNTLEEILKGERIILNEFESKIWKANKNCKECLSIIHIKPERRSYEVAVASSQPNSELIEEMCFLERIPKEYFANTGLSINRKDVDCDTLKPVPTAGQPIEYTVNAFFDIRSKSIRMNKMFISFIERLV